MPNFNKIINSTNVKNSVNDLSNGIRRVTNSLDTTLQRNGGNQQQYPVLRELHQDSFERTTQPVSPRKNKQIHDSVTLLNDSNATVDTKNQD